MKIALCGYREVSRVGNLIERLELVIEVIESDEPVIEELLHETLDGSPFLEICVESVDSVAPILEQLFLNGIREKLRITGAVDIVFEVEDFQDTRWVGKWQGHCPQRKRIL